MTSSHTPFTEAYTPENNIQIQEGDVVCFSPQDTAKKTPLFVVKVLQNHSQGILGTSTVTPIVRFQSLINGDRDTSDMPPGDVLKMQRPDLEVRHVDRRLGKFFEIHSKRIGSTKRNEFELIVTGDSYYDNFLRDQKSKGLNSESPMAALKPTEYSKYAIRLYKCYREKVN